MELEALVRPQAESWSAAGRIITRGTRELQRAEQECEQAAQDVLAAQQGRTAFRAGGFAAYATSRGIGGFFKAIFGGFGAADQRVEAAVPAAQEAKKLADENRQAVADQIAKAQEQREQAVNNVFVRAEGTRFRVGRIQDDAAAELLLRCSIPEGKNEKNLTPHAFAKGIEQLQRFAKRGVSITAPAQSGEPVVIARAGLTDDSSFNLSMVLKENGWVQLELTETGGPFPPSKILGPCFIDVESALHNAKVFCDATARDVADQRLAFQLLRADDYLVVHEVRNIRPSEKPKPPDRSKRRTR